MIKTRKLKIKEIGRLINRIREYKSISADTLADNLRISKANIKALENGQVDLLPEEVFIKGMIKRIAERLGINAEVLIQKINADSFENTEENFQEEEEEEENSLVSKILSNILMKKPNNKKSKEANHVEEEIKKAQEAYQQEVERLENEARLEEEARLAEKTRIEEEARLAEKTRIEEEARLEEEARSTEENHN